MVNSEFEKVVAGQFSDEEHRDLLKNPELITAARGLLWVWGDIRASRETAFLEIATTHGLDEKTAFKLATTINSGRRPIPLEIGSG